MNIKIAICDDEEEQVIYLTELCRKWSITEKITVDILTFPSSESYLFYSCEDKSMDLLLLDIVPLFLCNFTNAAQFKVKSCISQCKIN